MKKFENLLKSNGELIAAIILFLSGIAFISSPTSALAVVLRIVGGLIILWEAVYIYSKLRLFKDDRLDMLLFISNEAFLIICALIILISPLGAIKALSFIIGLYLLLTSAISLFRKISSDGKFEFGETAITVVSVIFGFWLVLSPFDILRLTAICIGVALILMGINTVWSYINNDGERDGVNHDDENPVEEKKELTVEELAEAVESIEEEINKLRE